MFVPQLLEKNQRSLEYPKYQTVNIPTPPPPPPPPPPIQDTFVEPPLLTFQDYTTVFNSAVSCAQHQII
jgi:hypothetical protein